MGVVSLKHHPSGSLASDVRTLFYILRTRRTKLFVYGFIFSFVACTAFFAFCPAGEGSPWFNEFFATATASTASYRSQFSSFIFRFFPNSTSPSGESSQGLGSRKGGVLGRNPTKDGSLGKNQTMAGIGSGGNDGFVKNQTSSGSESQQGGGVLPGKQAKTGTGSQQSGASTSNQASSGVGSQQNGILGKNQTMPGSSPKQSGDPVENQTTAKTQTPRSNPAKGAETVAVKNQAKGENTSPLRTNSSTLEATNQKGSLGGNMISNISASLAMGKSSPSSMSAAPVSSNGSRHKRDWSVEAMRSCDVFHGTWVEDDSYPLYPEGSCPHIDEQFNCFLNGRPDRSYQKLRWQPSGCNIPRLNATDMLERLRGKRLAFVGDSLNRNMWESLVCILRNSVKDKNKVFEASGSHEFRTEGSYSFLFKDYGCTVEFFRSPFLVQEWEMPDTNGKKKETLRLDIIERSSSRYKDADIIVFNTGHWWTHYKTSKGKDYYQEGNRIYSELDVVEAFHKALNTWAKWLDANINPKKSLVFFRGYSAVHFRGGRWNSGGQCDSETQPIKNEKYLSSYPSKMNVLESVLKGMKTPVSYLNITRMTDYRKDAHPAIYRKRKLTEAERKSPDRYQDCSHWCLPGVPDSWNELLYALLLIKQHQI